MVGFRLKNITDRKHKQNLSYLPLMAKDHRSQFQGFQTAVPASAHVPACAPPHAAPPPVTRGTVAANRSTAPRRLQWVALIRSADIDSRDPTWHIPRCRHPCTPTPANRTWFNGQLLLPSDQTGTKSDYRSLPFLSLLFHCSACLDTFLRSPPFCKTNPQVSPFSFLN